MTKNTAIRKSVLSLLAAFASAACMAGSADPACTARDAVWRFAVIADARGDGTNTPAHPWVNAPVLHNIAEAVVQDQAELVIFPGDLIMGNNYWSPKNIYTNMAVKFAQFKDAVQPIIDAGIPLYPVRGNHETYDMIDAHTPTHEALPAWLEAFGDDMPQNGPAGQEGFTYSFAHQNALFIGLEQYWTADYQYDPDNYALDWLESQLAANTREHVFVFGHAPVFQALDPECLMRHADNGAQFWRMLDAAGVRLYFCAHEHLYGRARACVDGASLPRQVIMGTSGGPLNGTWDGTYLGDGQDGAKVLSEAWHAQKGDYGYLLVEVDGPRVTMQYKISSNLPSDTPVWTINDTFSYDLDVPEPVAALCYSNTIAETSAYIANIMAQHNVPAMSIALVDGDRTVWAAGFGMANRERGIPAGPDTIFRIASMSKAFAGLTVMKLREQGLLDLEDPITNTIPSFSMLPRYGATAPITIRSLLAHQSGIPGLYYKNGVSTVQRSDYYATVLTLLAEDYPHFPPDFMEQYNNNGVTLIEGVVAGACGQDYRTCALDRLLGPMGLSNTVFTLTGDQTNRLARYYSDGILMPDEYVNAFASGGKYSSVRDLGRWISFLLGYGALGGTQVLSSNSIATVWSDQSDRVVLRGYENFIRTGLGWDNVADPAFAYAGRACHKNGGSEGYGSFTMVIPERRLGVAVLNSISGDAAAQPAARYAMRMALLEKYGLPWPTNIALLPITPAVSLPPEAFNTITGHYALPNGYDLVSLNNNALTLTQNAHSDSPVVHSGLAPHEDGWFYTDAGQPAFQITFTNVAGRVFMKKRVSAGTWIETFIASERFVPAPIGQPWHERAAKTWSATGLSDDDYFRATGRDMNLNLTIHNGVLMVSGFCGSAVLQPQSDDLAFAFAMCSAEVYALQSRSVNGRECLHYGGYDFYPKYTPGAFAYAGSDLTVYAQASGLWYIAALNTGSRAAGGGWRDGDSVKCSVSGIQNPDSLNTEHRTLNTDVIAWAEAWGAEGMIPVPGDYDGDGMTDLAVYDTASGAWYIASLTSVQSSVSSIQTSKSPDTSHLKPKITPGLLNTEYRTLNTDVLRVLAWAQSWGDSGMTPVMGDYDGDGIWDLAVYDVAGGRWFIMTLDGRVLAWDLAFGYQGAMPVPGDYDGDGAYDLAVYSEANSLWHIASITSVQSSVSSIQTSKSPNASYLKPKTTPGSLNTVHCTLNTDVPCVLAWDVPWGGPGMLPVMGDYDGDGRFDMSVYDTIGGRWYIRTLSGTELAWDFAFGYPGAAPVPGDYDNDKAWDLAVYGPADGLWHIYSLRNGVLAWGAAWGGAGMIPAMGQ